MNAVEIEEAITNLAADEFDADEFPFQFLEAFGNKQTTIKRLRSGSSNSSNVDGGLLQRNNIHIAVAPEGDVTPTLLELKNSQATGKAKAKFVLATDGSELQAEDLNTGETVACEYREFPNHFGFFLPLAGISTVSQIRNNPIDIQATGRLNHLYVELLKENEEWASDAKRHEMNQFMTRLIFCFFAEDTDIFRGQNLFTSTIEKMSDSRSGNIDFVIGEIFRAMDADTENDERLSADLPRWADDFPYVNGGLFSGSKEVPKFSRIARSRLLHAGNLNWKEINPDIFGSMIQAVAEEDERGELGMHYTSVPNILKVLNPLFLDDLREQLEEAGDNARKLLNLRKRIATIRVFDPACGSGNFLVIAYIQMREIEAEIQRRRNEANQRSWIRLENFYGIEIKNFAVEVARLSLLIAEFQCDVRFIGQKEAKSLVLPLKKTGQISHGNALRLDWTEVCPLVKQATSYNDEDHVGKKPSQLEHDFEGQEIETYICGNPPYLGSKWQSKEQKAELEAIFKSRTSNWKSMDYVAGWFMKAADYGTRAKSISAFVSTNSICQGLQVPILWPLLFDTGHEITFAYTSFSWSNLASHNAGVTVAIIGFSNHATKVRKLYSLSKDGDATIKEVQNINAYLVPGSNSLVMQARTPISGVSRMLFGNMPRDGGNFVLTSEERRSLIVEHPELDRFVRPYLGSEQMIQGKPRWCIWIEDADLEYSEKHSFLREVMDRVREVRSGSAAKSTRDFALKPHRFVQIAGKAKRHSLAVAKVSSERRPYLPVDLLDAKPIISDLLFALYDAPLWNMAIVASRLHLVWVSTVCGKMKTDFRYSNTLGWNTFPIPILTKKNESDLTDCAEKILLAREACFPATIAELYDPEKMPNDLRDAHACNDEVLERIYIGRRFKNDTERLEKLFDLYSRMTSHEMHGTASGITPIGTGGVN